MIHFTNYESLRSAAVPETTELVLLRHGRTEANEKRLYCGIADLPVSAGGTEELLRLRGAYPSYEGYTVYTSGLRRTEETLRLLFGDRPHRTEPRLREMDFGDFTMHAYEELRGNPAYQDWVGGDNESNRCPNGESGAEMRERALAAFWEIAARKENALLVMHGGPIAVIMGAIFPEEGKNGFEWQPGNGRGFSVHLAEGKPVLWCAVPDESSEKRTV